MADADERRVLTEWVVLRNAVDRRRGDQNRAGYIGLERRGERDCRPFDVHRADRATRGLDRQRGRRVDEHVGAVDQARRRARVPHVAAQLLDRALELGVVQRGQVERAHVVPVRHEPAREMQAQKARTA